MGSVTEQVADDRTALQGFFDLKEGFSGDESIAHRFIPALGVLPLADDHVFAVPAPIECHTRALHAVANDSDDFIFQNFLCFRERELVPGHHIFFRPAKIQFCHVDRLFVWMVNVSQ